MTDTPTPENPLEETKRTSRILEIIQIIAAHPCELRRRDLAERFDVSDWYKDCGILVLEFAIPHD
jgi:hypothetical protein